MTRRFAAIVLGSQAVVVIFAAVGARAMAAAGQMSGAGHEDRAGTYLLVGSLLAVLCVIAAGLMRRPYGVSLGWFVQAACLLSAIIVPTMLVVGLLFLVLWVAALYQGQKMDALTAAHVRDHARQ